MNGLQNGFGRGVVFVQSAEVYDGGQDHRHERSRGEAPGPRLGLLGNPCEHTDKSHRHEANELGQ